MFQKGSGLSATDFVAAAPDPPRSLSTSIALSLQGSEPFHNGTPAPVETIYSDIFLFSISGALSLLKLKEK